MTPQHQTASRSVRLRSVFGDRLVWYVAGGALLLAVATIVGGLLNSPQVGIRTPMGSPSMSAANLLQRVGIWPLDWLACGLTSPLFVWLARRFPFPGRSWKWSALSQLGLVVLLVMSVAWAYLELIVPAGLADAEFRRYFIVGHLFVGVPPFGVMILTIQSLEFARRYRERELEAVRLQSQLTAARLDALTAQLHPHFLFNTLQGISTLIHRDPAAADGMLHRLSDLLRLTLERGDRQETTLEEELSVLQHYVDIQQERFRDRLTFEIESADSVRQALVPFFILQPLVENAVRHGADPSGASGTIHVDARRQGEWVRLRVTDDGPGVGGRFSTGQAGLGLSNTRRRLEQLYGQQFELELRDGEAGGAVVTILLPYRETSTAGKGAA